MPTITVQDVRAIAAELTATDAAIQLQIDVVGEKVGACLDANYTPALAKAIMIYTVAYFADKGARNVGAITSRKWADGDAETYGEMQSDSSKYWGMVLQLDSASCVANAFRSGKVFAVTGRTSQYYDGAQ